MPAVRGHFPLFPNGKCRVWQGRLPVRGPLFGCSACPCKPAPTPSSPQTLSQVDVYRILRELWGNWGRGSSDESNDWCLWPNAHLRPHQVMSAWYHYKCIFNAQRRARAWKIERTDQLDGWVGMRHLGTLAWGALECGGLHPVAFDVPLSCCNCLDQPPCRACPPPSPSPPALCAPQV